MTDTRSSMPVARRSILAAAGTLAGAALLGGVAAGAAQAPAASSRRAAALFPPGKVPVAFVMDDAATMIDFAGPWEVFQDATAGQVPGFHLYTVARTTEVMQTTGNMSGEGADMQMSGLKFTPDYSFAEAPHPTVIVVGAQVRSQNPAKLAWLRSAAEHAEIVLSVCTGAFILGHAGLLDGLEATTHHEFYDSFATSFPRVRLVRSRRFVDTGKIITAGGLTSGIDAALHVVSRKYGAAAAEATARYMEHDSTGWRSGLRA